MGLTEHEVTELANELVRGPAEVKPPDPDVMVADPDPVIEKPDANVNVVPEKVALSVPAVAMLSDPATELYIPSLLKVPILKTGAEAVPKAVEITLPEGRVAFPVILGLDKVLLDKV